MNALLDAESVRVDLGMVESRTFVNNVSFGIYAEPAALDLPVTCSIRPGALQVLLPRQRAGIPEEPAWAARRRSGLPVAGVQ